MLPDMVEGDIVKQSIANLSNTLQPQLVILKQQLRHLKEVLDVLQPMPPTIETIQKHYYEAGSQTLWTNRN